MRTALRGEGDKYEDTVTISITKASEMLVGLEYLETKTSLALIAAQRLDQYNGEYLKVDSLHNQIARGTKAKATALGLLDYLISENEQTFWLFRNFLTKEPLNEQYEGVEMLLGRGSFTQDIDYASVLEAFREGRNQVLRVGLRTVDERAITKMGDLPFFEYRFQHLLRLYTTLKS